MELRNARIKCYRRFAESNTVRLHQNLIALVGQNEAGKSSFLDALEELNDSEEISEFDATRHKNCDPEISATFTLDSDDYDTFGYIDGAENVNEWTITKSSNGDVLADFDAELHQDLQPRQEAKKSLENIQSFDVVQNSGSNSNQRRREQDINNLQDLFQSKEDYFGEQSIELIEELSEELSGIIDDPENPSEEEEQVLSVSNELTDLARHEHESPPHQLKTQLKFERPEFVSFDEEDRRLQNTYELEKYNNNKFPDALENLAELADLDLDKLKEAAASGNRARVSTLKTNATENLEAEFSESWVQEEVVPIIDVNGTVLHLHVRTQDEQQHSPIEDRSDGLRWFVALVAFLNSKDAGANPILLVDEAEQHLSYDAQARLIKVLESQELAQKVIYTTHSAGCLPSDLGTSIRPILPADDKETSSIENGFWKEGNGFSPLMMSMGLSSFAFSVARNALIGEGPCECILLPSLIREATGMNDLRYQVAPGSSTTGSESLERLLSESGRTGFIVDGDEGGEDLKQDLIDAGASEEQIISYRDFENAPIVLEDLIDPDIYVQAFNEELERWQPDEYDETEARLQTADLPETGRDNSVKNWCDDHGFAPVQKTTLSQRLAEKADQGTSIVDSDKEAILVELHSWAEDHFHVQD